MKYKTIDFPGSYMFLSKHIKFNELSYYKSYSICDYSLLLSEDVLHSNLEYKNKKAILIGYLFDIRDANKNKNDILKELLDSEDIVEELEYINGRYLILTEIAGSLDLYSDASQLQPLVYNSDNKSLASHDSLLAGILNDNNINIEHRTLQRYSELDFTRYKNIFKLNPSLKLNLNSFTFKRIYPRSAHETSNVSKVFKNIKPYLDQSIEWLKKQDNDIFLSITGGIDSRVSAALTHSLSEQIEYLTYFIPEKNLSSNMAKIIHRTDLNIAQSMKYNMKWKHNIINLSKLTVNKQSNKNFSYIFNSRHGYGLIDYYKHNKKYKHALHIKSTVFGMGKADFDPFLDSFNDTIEFYKKCVHGLSKDFHEKYDVEKEISNYFERNQVTAGVTDGRHYFDLYHLESRMGNWHSNITLETDPEVDEFIFTNCRKLIDLIQQPSVEDRRAFKLYKMIVNSYWPILLHFGINNQKNLYEQYNDEHLFKNTLLIEKNNSMFFDDKGEYFYTRPFGKIMKATNSYMTKVKNITTREVKILLKSKYKNPKARGKISVIIHGNKFYGKWDILDLYDGIELSIDKDGLAITIIYDNTFKNPSWKTAARLFYEIL